MRSASIPWKGETTMLPIDTMKVVEQLTEAGVPEKQARAYAYVLLDSLNCQERHTMMDACSKNDLKAALAPIESRLTVLESKVEALPASIAESIAKLKSEMLTWIISLGLLQGALALAIGLIPAGSSYIPMLASILLSSRRAGSSLGCRAAKRAVISRVRSVRP